MLVYNGRVFRPPFIDDVNMHVAVVEKDVEAWHVRRHVTDPKAVYGPECPSTAANMPSEGEYAISVVDMEHPGLVGVFETTEAKVEVV